MRQKHTLKKHANEIPTRLWKGAKPNEIKDRLKKIRELRKEIIEIARAPKEASASGVSDWHKQDEGKDVFLEVDEFDTIDDAVAPYFRKFILDRARSMSYATPKLRDTLGENVNGFKNYLRRPLYHVNFAQITADLSVLLEIDVEVILDLALKAERAFQLRDITYAVRGGTELTGPILPKETLSIGSQDPLPELKK